MNLLTKASLSGEMTQRERDNLQIAYEADCEGVVLLKNEKNILPLDAKKPLRVAVIGPNAVIAAGEKVAAGVQVDADAQ